MLQWDLTDTPLAREGSAVAVPTEGELLALMVGLLLLEGIAYDELTHRELGLSDGDREGLARLLEDRLPELAREFGSSGCLRRRLVELVGIKMTRSVDSILP